MKNKYILASGSPRREELLKLLDIDFTIEVSDICEDLKKGLTFSEIVEDLAIQKANHIALNHKDTYVLGFDTLVILDNEALGKPNNRKEAFEMLQKLSGKSHDVLTGCAIVYNDTIDTFYTSTKVTFNDITELEINEYLDTNEPFDKAGAYGIQGHGARYIKGIEGDYYSVMGLPIQKLYKKVRNLEK
jgi:septum formation protein